MNGIVSPVFGNLTFSGNKLSSISVALPPVVPICVQSGICANTSARGTGSTTFKKASDALPCSRIAFSTVGHDAIPI